MNYFDLGGSGMPLHFLHANGYPPECYSPLFAHLQKTYRVFGMKLRPLWQDASMSGIKDWQPYSDDLQKFLSDRPPRFETTIEPGLVIGAGHSIGGIVTLRAALRNPNMFTALILIDPVLFVPQRLAAWQFVNWLGLGGRLHPKVKGALSRRRRFDDLGLLYRGYRNRDVFRYMSDENLKIYIEGITHPKPDGTYELVFPPEWESHIYLTGLQDFDLWRDIPKLQIPTLVLRGAESDTFLPNAVKLLADKNPKIKVRVFEKATHILPLEYPREVAESIDQFIQSLPIT